MEGSFIAIGYVKVIFLMSRSRLEDGEELEEETIWDQISLIDGWDHPVGVFRFKYRSKGAYTCPLPTSVLFAWRNYCADPPE